MINYTVFVIFLRYSAFLNIFTVVVGFSDFDFEINFSNIFKNPKEYSFIYPLCQMI